MAQFSISKDSVKILKDYQRFYSSVNKISSISTTLFVADKQQLSIYYTGLNTDRDFLVTKCVVPINESLKFMFEVIDFKNLKLLDQDLIFDYDPTLNQLSIIDSSGIKTLNLSNSLDDAERKAVIDYKSNLNSTNKLTEVLLTDEITAVITAMSNCLKVCETTNSIQIDNAGLKTSDSASVIYYNKKLPVNKFLFHIDASDLIKKLTGDILEVYQETSTDHNYFNITTANYDFLWSPRYFNLDLPTKPELNAVIPDSRDFHTTTINSLGLLDAIKSFEGIFEKSTWRWGQISFFFDEDNLDIIDLFYKTSAVQKKNLICGKHDDESGDFILPTNYLKHLLPLFSEDLSMDYNFIGPRDIHGAAVSIKSGDFEVALCKLILASV